MFAKYKNSISLIVLLLFAMLVGYANYAYAGAGKGGGGGFGSNQEQQLLFLQVFAQQHRASGTTSGNQ